MAAKRNPVAQYFVNIIDAIVTTCKGMKLTASYLVGKPVTMQYPEVKPVVPPGARGIHEFVEAQCMACNQCVKICPVSCIKLEFVGRGKDAMITGYDIDYQRCLFCNLCSEICPTNAINLTGKWDLCGESREDCIIHFVRGKSLDEIKAYEAEMAAKEAEKKRKAAEAAAAKSAAEAKPPEAKSNETAEVK